MQARKKLLRSLNAVMCMVFSRAVVLERVGRLRSCYGDAEDNVYS